MQVDDVFPRRNLPGEAEVWGRDIEVATKDNARGVAIVSQELAGLNRSTASSLESLARQLDLIAEQQAGIAAAQATAATALAAVPIASLNTASASGFTPTTSWQTIATTSVSFPADKSTASAQAVSTVSIIWDTSGSGYPILATRTLISGAAGVKMGVAGLITSAETTTGRQAGTSQAGRIYSGSGSVTAETQVLISGYIGSPGSFSWTTNAQVVLNATFTT
jgi:hypothetical protein